MDLFSPAVHSPRTFWQRRLLDPLVKQLTQGITPEKIALTIAVGSACALFPLLGTTTLLCALVGIALRLNQPIIQLINQAMWPVHIVVMYACIRLGETIFQAPHVSFGIRQMNHLFWNEPAVFWGEFGATVMHAVVAWALLAPVFIAVVYVISLAIARGIAKVKAEVASDEPPSLT